MLQTNQIPFLGVLTLALLATAGCAGNGLQDLDAFEDDLDAAIEELENSSVNLEDEIQALAISVELDEDSIEEPGRPVDPMLEQMLHSVRRMAFEETCPIVAAATGRFATDRNNPDVGMYNGVVLQGRDYVIADLTGGWKNFNGLKDGGFLDGRYGSPQTAARMMRGQFLPPDKSPDSRFGTYRMAGEPLDTTDGEVAGEVGSVYPVTQGVWHRGADGHGVFLGYWAHCDLSDRDRPDDGTTDGE